MAEQVTDRNQVPTLSAENKTEMLPMSGKQGGSARRPLPEKRTCEDCGAECRPEWQEYIKHWLYVLPCDCKKKKEQARQERLKSFEEQRKALLLFSQSQMSPRFKTRTFATFKPVVGSEEALRVCLDFAKRFSEWKREGKGLMFSGIAGCGKTHLAAACMNELMKQGVPCLFIVLGEYLDKLRSAYNSEEVTVDHLENTAASVAVLLLDDIGTEKLPLGEKGDWARERIYRLINRRYENLLPTLITTNESPEALEERYGYRVISRLDEMCVEVPMKAVDYRIRKSGIPKEPK
jgi:DNA replication protein DnaC